MKILFLITGMGLGGAERQVADMADRLAARGNVVKIAFLIEPVRVKPENKEIEMVCLQLTASPFSLPHAGRKLVQLVREFQPDVVHSHMVHANLLARICRLFSKMPRLVCTAHSNNEGGMLRMWAYRITDALADISTNVSNEAVVAFERLGAVKKGRMIPVLNGIDIDKFQLRQQVRTDVRQNEGISTERIVLAVGRLYEVKQYPMLLRAFSQLGNEFCDVRLWIVGDGPLLLELERLSSELGVSSRVKFFGARHDIPEIMSAADVFVLSSEFEGFGLVVGEAMSMSKVVVATDCGGVSEVLGDCGYLVSADDLDQLAAGLREALCLTPDQAEQIGKRARLRIVENYSIDSVVDRWIHIYNGRYGVGREGCE